MFQKLRIVQRNPQRPKNVLSARGVAGGKVSVLARVDAAIVMVLDEYLSGRKKEWWEIPA